MAGDTWENNSMNITQMELEKRIFKLQKYVNQLQEALNKNNLEEARSKLECVKILTEWIREEIAYNNFRSNLTKLLDDIEATQRNRIGGD